jgi:hypothetical protein
MAFLYLSEYSEAAISRNGVNLPVGQEPSIDQTPIAIGDSAEQSEPFQPSTQFIRVEVDATCSIVIGPATGEHPVYQSPLATINNKRLVADSAEYFGVPPGKGYCLSVIANS